MGAALTRVAVWTPLPPQPGSVALQNAALAPELARHVEVTVVVDDWVAPLATEPAGCRLIGASEFVARGSPADLNVYHLADDFDTHAYVHEALLRSPGLVVLHDLGLSSFYRTMWLRSPELLHVELWRNHGGHVAESDLPHALLLRRIVDASLGVVVDSPGTAADIGRRFPALHLDVVPRPRPPRTPDAAALDLRAELGWEDDDLVVGTIGTLDPSRRPELSAAVVAACRVVDERVRLIVAGRAPDVATVDRVEAAITAMGRGAGVVATDVTAAAFDACIDASDLLLDLRTGTGCVPTTLVRGLGAGVPAITTDLQQFQHLDPACCWRVPEDARGALRRAADHVLDVLGRRVDLVQARAAARQQAAEWDVAKVAVRQLQVAHATLARRPRVRVSETGPTRPLNIHGDFLAATGLMEVGRRLTRALVDSPLDVRIADIISFGPTHSVSRAEPELVAVSRLPSAEGDHLWLANINEFVHIDEETLRPPGTSGRVIGLWFWELPRLPAFVATHVQRVDEIWVASEFVRDAMRHHTTRPVHVIPIPIEPRLPISFGRRDYELPDDAVVYFFNLDSYSIVGRKNPFGAIAAFKRAFNPSERGRAAQLVIKCTNLAPRPAFAAALHRAMDEIGGVVLSGDLEHAEMNGLLSSIDVYVSLHRSEGFGIGMAEAMALGKPVIATAFSGNVDFMKPKISCPVGYRVRLITDLDHEWWPEGSAVYPPGFTYWAEPDIDEAARWMRLLFDEPELRRRIGGAAATHIADHYSSARARAAVLDLLARSALVAA
jgi:glycosyltransferase involved in cell wall biosynthesis